MGGGAESLLITYVYDFLVFPNSLNKKQMMPLEKMVLPPLLFDTKTGGSVFSCCHAYSSNTFSKYPPIITKRMERGQDWRSFLRFVLKFVYHAVCRCGEHK